MAAKVKTKNQAGNRRYVHILERLKAIDRVPNGLVIDCACGNGYPASLISNEGFEILGFDIDVRMVAEANERGVKAQQRNICNLAYEEDVADGFICSETLEHLTYEETIMAVNEIKKVCKKGAIVCITVPEDEKACMESDLHKQYLSLGDLMNHFSEFKLLDVSTFCKRKDRCNLVVIFKYGYPYSRTN